LLNGLAHTLLKLTAPGVPDLYQGSEMWDFSLVDPDNRRAVDFNRRRTLLEGLARAAEAGTPGWLRDLLENLPDGRIKLYLIHRCLELRRQEPALFRDGTYIPLAAHGPRTAQVCAFARHRAGTTLITAVPRLLARYLHDGTAYPEASTFWNGTSLSIPAALACPAYDNLLTGELVPAEEQGRRLPASALFTSLPVALLCTRPEYIQ
jgi:(1->4)-alpha-D-glucan 1-alpha-D-glucosylmutase